MTYEELLKAWRSERESEGLSKLPDDFYARVAEFISELRGRLKMADMTALRTRLAKKELENVEKMVKDIFNRRVEKILKALASGRTLDVEKLTPEERELLSPIEEAFTAMRKFLESLLRGEVRKPEATKTIQAGPSSSGKFMLVRILADVPAIVGADMKTHGPFKRGDVAFIPRENAIALVKKGLAVEVELA
ncbi:hypothetical protein B6U66_02985 [Candidatus Bathyarchaeota archaeon ex4484_135]|nr:MAG: hypothetical protein B6U66_02985 [Candidatus Bathyarchaeota archaeon ex4484_135]